MESNRKKKKWPWITLAVVLVLVIGTVWLIQRARLAAQSVTYESYTVKRGSVTSTVTGSGRLSAADTLDIDVPEGVKVADVAVLVGDEVALGDTIASFDSDSLAERAATLSSQLASLDAELLRMESAKTTETVYAPLAGRLKALFVSTGDDALKAVAQHGALALLSTDGLMQLSLETSAALQSGDGVSVRWEGGEAEGTVAQKSAAGYLITLSDKDAPFGQTAEVYLDNAPVGSGSLSLHAPAAVLATGGTIKKINYDLGDKLTAASKLFTLENGPFTSAYQIKFAQRTQTAAQLETVLAYLADPRITAPADGVIGSLFLLGGKTTGSASNPSLSVSASTNGKTTGATLHAGGPVKMTLAVDEIDILSLAIGQSATVTLDALPGETFEAFVTHISNIGETARSVASFAVELTLTSNAHQKLGMNGNATILVERIEDALLVPVLAISEDSEGAYVLVGDALTKTYITTGLSDGENAIVTSGLQEGDLVKYAMGTTMYDTLMSMRGPFGNGRD